MITAGIDLASQPARTGRCVIDWADSPQCVALSVGVSDAEIVATAVAAQKCGVDAPFGWPDDFVAAITDHHRGGHPEVPVDTEDLRLRATDLWVWQHHGRRPLSVSTDLIGVTALRCVRIQRMVADATGRSVDRTGTGLLVETYPAAALTTWGLPASGYKRSSPRAGSLLPRLAAEMISRFGIEMSPEHAALAASNDDAFDAIVCAIVARLVIAGETTLPPAPLAAAAAREGWIHVPGPTVAP